MPVYSETTYLNSSLAGQYQLTRQGDTRISRRVQLPAARAGVVTSNAEGSAVLTIGADHGIEENDLVGVFWAAGQRIDVLVASHNATTITVTVATGVGTAIPIATTVITVGVQVQQADVAFLATAMQKLEVGAPLVVAAESAVGVNFTDDADSSLLHTAVADGECYLWVTNNGPANPITGTVAKMNCYSGKATAAEVAIGVLLT